MPAFALWLMRWMGRLLLAASAGVVVGVTLWQLARGGVDLEALRGTPRDELVFRNSLLLALGAVVGSHLLALPVILVLSRQPSGSATRGLLLGLTILPLICMPSVYAYAWLLVASSTDGLSQGLARLLGWAGGAQIVHAAWVLSLWLWPVPALVLATAFQRVGRGAYRLALLDATPTVAILRGAWPAMRPAVFATSAAVAILAATDSTVPPLLLTPDVWSVEISAKAAVAASRPCPAGRLLLESWRMLIVLGALTLLAAPGFRQMLRWGDEPDVDAADAAAGPRRAATWTLFAYVAVVTLAPLAVFFGSLAGGRYDIMESFRRAFQELRRAAPGSIGCAAAAGVCSVLIASAALLAPRASRQARWVSRGVAALVLLGAVLPPALSATALISFYSSRFISPRDYWNLYDNTPVAWLGGLLVRYAFIPVCLAILLQRRAPVVLADQAAADTASGTHVLAAAGWPLVRRAVYACGLLVACLCLSEVQMSTVLQPPQWGGGSLAVVVDSHMHYGRHNRTVAMAILMMAPAVLAAMVFPWAVRGARRVLRERGPATTATL